MSLGRGPLKCLSKGVPKALFSVLTVHYFEMKPKQYMIRSMIPQDMDGIAMQNVV
jgi:hypothetical protein